MEKVWLSRPSLPMLYLETRAPVFGSTAPNTTLSTGAFFLENTRGDVEAVVEETVGAYLIH